MQDEQALTRLPSLRTVCRLMCCLTFVAMLEWLRVKLLSAPRPQTVHVRAIGSNYRWEIIVTTAALYYHTRYGKSRAASIST